MSVRGLHTFLLATMVLLLELASDDNIVQRSTTPARPPRNAAPYLHASQSEGDMRLQAQHHRNPAPATNSPSMHSLLPQLPSVASLPVLELNHTHRMLDASASATRRSILMPPTLEMGTKLFPGGQSSRRRPVMLRKSRGPRAPHRTAGPGGTDERMLRLQREVQRRSVNREELGTSKLSEWRAQKVLARLSDATAAVDAEEARQQVKTCAEAAKQGEAATVALVRKGPRRTYDREIEDAAGDPAFQSTSWPRDAHVRDRLLTKLPPAVAADAGEAEDEEDIAEIDRIRYLEEQPNAKYLEKCSDLEARVMRRERRRERELIKQQKAEQEVREWEARLKARQAAAAQEAEVIFAPPSPSPAATSAAAPAASPPGLAPLSRASREAPAAAEQEYTGPRETFDPWLEDALRDVKGLEPPVRFRGHAVSPRRQPSGPRLGPWWPQ